MDKQPTSSQADTQPVMEPLDANMRIERSNKFLRVAVYAYLITGFSGFIRFLYEKMPLDALRASVLAELLSLVIITGTTGFLALGVGLYLRKSPRS